MISVRVYFGIFIALIALTLLTTGAAFINLGANWNVVAALTIAVAKAILVALYFMHLRYSSHLTRLFAAAGIFWLALLLAGTMSDYLSREKLEAATTIGKIAP